MVKVQNWLIVLSLGLFSQASLAAGAPHPTCLGYGVESLNDDSNDWKVTYSRNISTKDDQEILALPQNVKQKLIIVAKNAVSEGYSGVDNSRFKKPSDIQSIVDAVEFIRQINESRDEEIFFAYLQNSKGNRINKVTFYPGAQVGSIFVDETLTIIATVNDGDISCVKE